MNHVLSWIKLKNFSNNAFLQLLSAGLWSPARRLLTLQVISIFVMLLVSSCATNVGPVKNDGNINRENTPLSGSRTPESPGSDLKAESPVPPWQVWDSVAVRPDSNSEMRAADELAEAGKLNEAIEGYRRLEQNGPSPREREEAFVRRLGTMLKLGKSRQVLDEVTQQVRTQGKKPEDVDASIGLIVAYSYLHIKDRQQTLAWLMLAYRKVRGQGVFARRAMTEARRIVRSIPVEEFSSQAQVWARDPALSPVFNEEKARRAGGGTPEPGQAPDWFNPAFYSADVNTGNLKVDDLNPAAVDASPPGGKAVVGILLPTTGKFAAFSTQIRQGIDLALKESGHEGYISLVYGDSAGTADGAVREYERLVSQGAAFVLGPLLVKDAEEVARKSEELQVPFLTFTKRPGITDLSRVGFRLGATAENQTDELVDYAVQQLHKQSFGMLYPSNDSSNEYLGAFRKSVEASQGHLLAEASYTPKDQQSAARAIEILRGKNPEAIFIPDSLEGLFAVLDAIKNSELKSAVLLGPALWNDPIASRGYGQLLDGGIFVTPYFSGSVRPKVIDFVTKYRQAYGKEPELLSAQAFDAGQLVFSLLEDAGISRQALIDKLRAVDNREGVTGQLTVRPNGEIERHMSVVRIQGGELQEITSGGFQPGN